MQILIRRFPRAPGGEVASARNGDAYWFSDTGAAWSICSFVECEPVKVMLSEAGP